MLEFRNDIEVQEAKGKLLKVWTLCEFDIKERVKEKVSHRIVQNILSNPNYKKLDRILEVIQVIEKEIEAVEKRVEVIKEDYYTEVNGLLSTMG